MTKELIESQKNFNQYARWSRLVPVPWPCGILRADQQTLNLENGIVAWKSHERKNF